MFFRYHCVLHLERQKSTRQIGKTLKKNKVTEETYLIGRRCPIWPSLYSQPRRRSACETCWHCLGPTLSRWCSQCLYGHRLRPRSRALPHRVAPSPRPPSAAGQASRTRPSWRRWRHWPRHGFRSLTSALGLVSSPARQRCRSDRGPAWRRWRWWCLLHRRKMEELILAISGPGNRKKTTNKYLFNCTKTRLDPSWT